MEELRQFFGEDGNGSITFEELTKGIASKGMKIADLSGGAYVSREKFDKMSREFTAYKTENDTSKYADYDSIKSELEGLKAEKADRELMNKLSDKKVKPEFAKFVMSEIKANVTDKKDFDKAMEEYLKENPQYIVVEENKPTFFKSSSAHLDNGSGDNKGINQRMNALLRGAKNK